MPLESEGEKETRSWLEKAGEDLRTAEILYKAKPPVLAHVMFHCQQAVEKTLKAFLTQREIPFRKTHNLREIGDQCLSVDPSLRELVEASIPLSDYAWEYRYPGEDEEPTRKEAQQAIAIAKKVYRIIAKKLPSAKRK
ncbi:MAG: HEPN domain-containing protein [Deltaproteobacteria bacterium]|nr:HEPN domain-containing protein [Deltaproteobacteria bacterium]